MSAAAVAGAGSAADGAERALTAPTVPSGRAAAHVPALHTQSKPSLHTRNGGMTADSVSTCGPPPGVHVKDAIAWSRTPCSAVTRSARD
ncbi:hypothetical protein PJP10_10125 [Mycobacterium kansasii]